MKNIFCENCAVHLIGIPNFYKNDIKSQVTLSLPRVRDLLKYKEVVHIVIIESQNFFVIEEIGLCGTAIGKFGIVINIDFSRSDINRIVQQELPATVCHEVSHIVRENTVGYGESLLDALVSEGIACYIEQLQFPSRTIPYIDKIRDEEKFIELSKKQLSFSKYDYSEWFLGTGSIPRWAGYRIGYLLITGFVKVTSISPANLVRMKSEDIRIKANFG